jgi:arylsulfatase A-like enzyme
LLLGQGEHADRPLFWHFPHYTNQGGRPAGAVRQGPWKLVVHYEDDRAELYHLLHDPRESTNLAAQEPHRTAQLRHLLDDWRAAAGAQLNQPNPALDLDLWRPLYEAIDVSSFQPATASDELWTRVRQWRQGMNAAPRNP